MKSYEEFRAAISQRESSGNYQAVNALGYLGAFQFGLMRLFDFRFTRRKAGQTATNNHSLEFIPPLSASRFLASKDIQDWTFDAHVADLAHRLKLIYAGDNLSGAVAAAHLVGFQATLEYLRFGKVARDGNGVSVEEYFLKFAGFEIPG